MTEPADDSRSVVRRGHVPRSASRPLVSPIWPSVVYASDDADMLDGQYGGRVEGFVYAREGHPNWAILAEKLDWMEGAKGGVVTGSGMAAVGAVFQAMLSQGDHVLASDVLYGRSLRILKQELPRQGIEVTFLDPTDAGAWAAAIRPNTRLALVEVIANPTIRVADMDGIIKACEARGVPVAVDNTFTTPALYRPLERGAEITIQSVTKMLAGHSDVTLGYVAARDPALNARLAEVCVSWGATPSPFDCWLAERGLHTFDLRFARAQANAAALADTLAGLSRVEAVFYPTQAQHPDHNRAMALLGGQGGTMLSFRLKGGRDEVNAFLRAADRIPFAPTLGDVATILSHPASSSHRAVPEAARAAIGITEGFIRVSVGIEDIGLLTREFTAAIG